MSTTSHITNPWEIEEGDFPHAGSREEQNRFLLRYALLAPSTRNTQPWKFALQGEEIQFFTDPSLWLHVADADQREMHISLGCALENLLLAAEYFGLGSQVAYFPETQDSDLVATVRLTPTSAPRAARCQELFPMIVERITHHEEYDGEPIPRSLLHHLQEECQEPGVRLHLTADAEVKRKVDYLVTRADAIEFADPAFREEMGHCIGQGNFGTPWLLSVLGQLAMSYLNLGKSTARKDHEVLMSSPVLGLLSTERDDREAWVKVGQALEWLWLLATAHGVSLQPVSQIMQIPKIRSELTQLLPGENLIPQQPFRLGYVETPKRHTPRRSLEETLVEYWKAGA